MVLGDGETQHTLSKRDVNTSLANTKLRGANLEAVFQGSTAGVKTGFGYVLSFNRNGLKHAVIATRGTRVEHSIADGLADLHAAITTFGGYGQVHAGFYNAFASIMPNLASQERALMDADVVHCVGHSLGGAIATLIAAHYAGRRGAGVKLYTFGSPRVGAYATPQAFESMIGKDSIYRVAHDLDPVTLVGPFPYSHVNGLPDDQNNMMLRSPTARLISVANHDMMQYVESIMPGGETGMKWANIRRMSAGVVHDNAVLARWLLRSVDQPSMFTQKVVEGLSVLLKAFAHFLQMQQVTSAIISGMTAIDMFSAALAKGIERVAGTSPEIMASLSIAAAWARVAVVGMKFTAAVIKAIMMRMMAVLKPIASRALTLVGAGDPLPLVLAGATVIAGTMLG
ncbi:MAG TPA: lipase family protein [Burkholderiaceae bacterium]